MATIRIAEPERPSRAVDDIDSVGGVYPIRALSLDRTTSKVRSLSRDTRAQQDERDEKLEDDEDVHDDFRQAGDFKQKQVGCDVGELWHGAHVWYRSSLANCFSILPTRVLV